MTDLTGLFVTSILVWLLKLTSGEKRVNQATLPNNNGILYACPLNSLCQCANLPNETYLHEINCHEVSLYKFPGKFIMNNINNKFKVRLPSFSQNKKKMVHI